MSRRESSQTYCWSINRRSGKAQHNKSANKFDLQRRIEIVCTLQGSYTRRGAMACNVFGTPITDETLKGMTKYHDKDITRLDKATVALEMKNAEGKDVSAHKFLDEVRSGLPHDGIKVVVYNGTGGPVKLVSYSYGDGCVGPTPIPMFIANGQWGAYFHTVDNKESGKNNGGHALVFAGKNADGAEQQWMYVMEENWPGRCSTEIRPAGYYPLSDNTYKNYSNNLAQSDRAYGNYCHHASSQGCTSFASIGGDSMSVFLEGIMTLDEAIAW